MSDETEKSFKVTDRRIYSDPENGTPEDEAPEDDTAPTDEHPQAPDGGEANLAGEEADAVGDEADAAAGEADAAAGEADAADEDAQAFPLNFATFVVSLGDSALIHLGAIPHPATGEPQPDMQAARQTIDILGILEEKTQGNLSDEEQKLMTNLLYTLRMQWIQANQG